MDAKDPKLLVQNYLAGTPLLPLFDQTLDFTIKTASRFEHHHIVAGSGQGKTQTLQYLIAHDLEAVASGNRTVIVLDSQGDLIRNISNLAVFAPSGPLHDRIVIIDPSDVEWPVSLNLFDVGMERLSGYAPLERERLTNSILELYDFVLGTLLSAEMTQKQNVIFRYVTRLMLHIPNATIHTLRELMEPDSQKKFADAISTLTGTAKQFFETEFTSKEFEQTKKQVLRRLWGILENQTFERMFAHPRSKLDLFAEMNAGKVILINTAKDLLKEQGTEIFGRFFIAMIAQAAQERATLTASERTPHHSLYRRGAGLF
jgi:DNA-directed RNA polymerase subunit L